MRERASLLDRNNTAWAAVWCALKTVWLIQINEMKLKENQHVFYRRVNPVRNGSDRDLVWDLCEILRRCRFEQKLFFCINLEYVCNTWPVQCVEGYKVYTSMCVCPLREDMQIFYILFWSLCRNGTKTLKYCNPRCTVTVTWLPVKQHPSLYVSYIGILLLLPTLHIKLSSVMLCSFSSKEPV